MPDPPLTKPGTIDPHRLAWGVLLLSFAIFCVIAAMVIVGVDYFLFQSTVPIKPVLSLGRGTVGVMDLANAIEQVGQNGTLLAQGAVISTDPQSQGTIQFLDPQSGDTVLATITVHNNSALTLREASRPRFQWSRTRPLINLGRISGKISIEIPASEESPLLLNLESTAGALVNLEGSGKYIITAAPDQLSVVNREGTATLIAPDLRQGHSIP
ncbi:MAG: hypothetical protein K8J31_06940, partial [Anaerolineae bacterium]|nr:hypothetical protein [Anaerolineae bacterium]